MKALPYSEKHEKALLSCILHEPLVCGRDALDEFGEDCPFFMPECALVWSAIRRIDLEKVSTLTVCDYLDGKVDELAVVDISRAAPSIAQFKLHMRHVQGQSIKRSLIGSLSAQVASLHDTHTKVDDVVDAVRTAMSDIVLGAGAHTVMTAEQMALQTLRELGNNEEGYYTHMHKLDQIVAPIPGGSFMILAGRPGMGKTTLYNSMQLMLGQQGVASSMFSLEMPVSQVTKRMVAALARVNSHPRNMAKNYVELEAHFQRFAGLPIFCKDTPGMTVKQLCREIKALHSAHGVKWHAVDHVGKVRAGIRCQSRENEISYISGCLKEVAMEIGGVVVGIVQLNRQAEGVRPQLHHLRESGRLEEDADIVAMLHGKRDCPETQALVAQGKPIEMELLVPKSRHTGPGMRVVPFYKHQSFFANDLLTDEELHAIV